MGNNGLLVIFLSFGFLAIVALFFFLSVQVSPGIRGNDIAIHCVNDDRKKKEDVGILVDDEKKTIILAGTLVPAEHMRVFNKTAIEAIWVVKGEESKVFLDRIAGSLRIYISQGGRLVREDSFVCSRSQIIF